MEKTMLLFLFTFACDAPKVYFYDISSTVMVTDEMGQQIDVDDVELCQRFRSEDTDTTTAWAVHAEQCETVDIDEGVAFLPNWEGEYFGPAVTIVLEHTVNGEVFSAELLDNDAEVWCDNEVVTEVDEHNNSVTYGNLCDENYERYLLWSLIIPSQFAFDGEEGQPSEQDPEASSDEDDFDSEETTSEGDDSVGDNEEEDDDGN